MLIINMIFSLLQFAWLLVLMIGLMVPTANYFVTLRDCAYHQQRSMTFFPPRAIHITPWSFASYISNRLENESSSFLAWLSSTSLFFCSLYVEIYNDNLVRRLTCDHPSHWWPITVTTHQTGDRWGGRGRKEAVNWRWTDVRPPKDDDAGQGSRRLVTNLIAQCVLW